MPVPRLITATVRATASGVLGVAVVEGARRAAGRGGLRDGAVTVTSWALRGRRRAEAGAESVRLAGADIVAEARAKVGEVAPPPTVDGGHDHAH